MSPKKFTCTPACICAVSVDNSLLRALGGAQNISAACDMIPWCDLFVYFPLGKSLNGSSNLATSAFLKSTRGSHQPSMQRRALKTHKQPGTCRSDRVSDRVSRPALLKQKHRPCCPGLHEEGEQAGSFQARAMCRQSGSELN